MHTRTNTPHICPNCGCQMDYIPADGLMRCPYCGSTTSLEHTRNDLKAMAHFIVAHRINTNALPAMLAKDIANDPAFPDNALTEIQIVKSEIVYLPCYRYHYWSNRSQRMHTKTYYASQIPRLPYAKAQQLVEKSIARIREFDSLFFSDNTTAYEAPYDANRYFFNKRLNHSKRLHSIKKIDYVHVAAGRVTFTYHGKQYCFWYTANRPDRICSMQVPREGTVDFPTKSAHLVPILTTVLMATIGIYFFRAHWFCWTLASLSAIGLGCLSIPLRKWLYKKMSLKKRSMLLQEWLDCKPLENVKATPFALMDAAAIPLVSLSLAATSWLAGKLWMF